MLKVFHAPQSRSSRLVWLLEELGAAYELVYVSVRRQDGSGGPDPANPHPLKQVPAIEHEGVAITESIVIFDYVCQLYPQAGLAPAPGEAGRAEFVSWLGLYNSVLEPVITAKFQNPDGMNEVQTAAYEDLHQRWSGALKAGPYILGERFSALDVLFASLILFFRTAMPDDKIYDQWVERLASRPALARAQAKDAPPA